jgi:hypothetical protein
MLVETNTRLRMTVAAKEAINDQEFYFTLTNFQELKS